jgi:hypothetical protein
MRTSSMLLFLGILLFAGCASRTVILAPGPIPIAADEGRLEGPLAWSVAVKEVIDARPQETRGERVGTLYRGLQEKPQAAFLSPPPPVYVKEQLSRYLLHRGLEASAPEAAKIFLTVELTDFALVENPGRVWDQVLVRIAYTVRFSDRSGRDLGHVTLNAGKQIDVSLASETQAKKAFREALAETFRSLAESDVFLRVLRSGQG